MNRCAPGAGSDRRYPPAGGLDLAATLAAGRPVAERGLLAEADGGLLVLAMAERVPLATLSYLVAALDTGMVRVERDGLTAASLARFALVALDEGIGDDERAPAKLRDRLAFEIDLSLVAPRDTGDPLPPAETIADARTQLASIEIGDDVIEGLATTAVALGIDSLRAVLLAVKASRAAAALGGRSIVSQDDAVLATRLVLASQATRIPQSTADEAETPPEPPQPEPPLDQAPDESETPPPPPDETGLKDLLLEAAKAAIPAGLLAQLQQAGAALDRSRSPDLPGHGFTAMPARSEGLSLPGMARGVAALVDSLEFKPQIASGHSAGAAILARMSLDQRISLKTLVSFNGAILPLAGVPGRIFSPIAKFLAGLDFVPRLAASRNADPAIIAGLLGNTGSKLDARGTELYARLARSPGHVAAALGMMANWDLNAMEPELPKLKPRFVLVATGLDRMIKSEDSFRLRERLPDCEVIFLRDLGHLAHEERPAEAAELILQQAVQAGILSVDDIQP